MPSDELSDDSTIGLDGYINCIIVDVVSNTIVNLITNYNTDEFFNTTSEIPSMVPSNNPDENIDDTGNVRMLDETDDGITEEIVGFDYDGPPGILGDDPLQNIFPSIQHQLRDLSSISLSYWSR